MGLVLPKVVVYNIYNCVWLPNECEKIHAMAFQLEISGKKAVPHTEPRDANKSQSWRARELGGTPTPEVWTQATAAPGPLLPSTGPPVL